MCPVQVYAHQEFQLTRLKAQFNSQYDKPIICRLWKMENVNPCAVTLCNHSVSTILMISLVMKDLVDRKRQKVFG